MLHRLPADPDREDHEGADVELRGEHLGAAVPERPLVVGAARGEKGGREREAQRGDVGEHVRRVGEQGERAGEPPAHHLRHHDERGEAEGRREPPEAPARPVRTELVRALVVVAAVVVPAMVVPSRAVARHSS